MAAAPRLIVSFEVFEGTSDSIIMYSVVQIAQYILISIEMQMVVFQVIDEVFHQVHMGSSIVVLNLLNALMRYCYIFKNLGHNGFVWGYEQIYK